MKKKVFIGLAITMALLALIWIGAYAEGGPPPRPTRKPQPTWRWDEAATPVPPPTITMVPTLTNTPDPPCGIIVSKEITQDTTWQAGCTYTASEGLHVHPGVTLAIPEGVTILMGSWQRFEVQGRLIVRGTVDSPVRMERLYEDLRWIGVDVHTSPTQLETRLVHLIVKGTWWGLRVSENSGIVSTTNCAFYGDAPQQF